MCSSLCDFISKVFNDQTVDCKRALSFYQYSWNHWTYKDVKLSTEIVGNILKKHNSGTGQFILLFVNVTQTITPLLFGVILSSCAFICMNSQFADLESIIERLKIRFILSNVLINRPILFEKFTYLEAFHIFGEKITLWKTEPRYTILDPLCGSFAYAITTSGTTGKAKIVKVTHESIVPNIICLTKIFKITENDVIYLSSPITFDPSIIEIFLAFINGASLCIIESDLKLIPNKLVFTLCNENSPTFIQTTPSIMRNLQKSKLFSTESKLKTLVLGGEAFPTIEEIISWKVHSGISIYNIYGLTEMSCWATINKVWPSDKTDISIGEPLTETLLKFKICDVDNIGELYIGSSTRICLVDDEEMTDIVKVLPYFRATGDLFKKIHEKYYYVGRKDDQVKRWGVTTHLSDIERIVKKCGFLNCICLADKYDGDLKIVLFIFAEENINFTTLRNKLKNKLNSASWPDDIIYLKDAPLTAHGKIDKTFLIEYLRNKNSKVNSEEYFQKYWKHFTGAEISEKGFISSGGDSFKALQFNAILKRYNVSDTFIGILLRDIGYTDAFAEFQQLITSKRLLNHKEFVDSNVKKLKTSTIPFSLRRNINNNEILYKHIKGRSYPVDYFISNNIIVKEICLKIHWKYYLGKCIDASPLGVILKNGDSLVIIGSHSGKIAVIDVKKGNAISECILPNRIESCACISDCGKYFYIGCYDGCVYKIAVRSGDILWNFSTEDIVKSTCCLFEGNIIFGSYDKNIYKINEDGTEIWRCTADGPILTEALIWRNKVFISTLTSTIQVLDLANGQNILKYTLSAPIFSTPAIVDDCIIIATVNGIVEWRSIETGLKIFTFESKEKIFSSVTPYKEDSINYLLFGSGLDKDINKCGNVDSREKCLLFSSSFPGPISQ